MVVDGDLRDLGSLRQRALLARLLVRAARPLTADRLIDELWPDDVPDTARHTLHVYVSRLRTALGTERDRLRSDTSGYRLIVEPDELDASRFEQLAAEGHAAMSDGDPEVADDRLRRALALWRGPALAEFSEEPFAREEAARLEQLRLAALEGRIRADLALGRHATLIGELRQLTLEQPFREVFWEQYMLALYRSGQQADALRVYGEARMRLADDLGIEPGPALRRMEQRVLAQDRSLDADTRMRPEGAPDHLPLQRTTFVGRERDLAIAGELLAASRLLTLTGAPGSGKTRMALRLASSHSERYADGAYFVPLAALHDPRLVETAIAAALEVPGAPGETLPERLRTHLQERKLLLVLDNFEQIAEAAPRVGRLLDDAPGLTVLVTSRSVLRLAGEQEFPVLPLQVPPLDGPLEPSALMSYDAVALLVARARASDPAFTVDPENAAAIAGITARLDGLPLAIELGAGRLRLLTPQSLLARLGQRLPLLASGTSDTIARHQTLRAAISWSYDLLEPTEQVLYRRLGAFVGGFTAEAAAAVADLPLEDVWSGIESLLSKSLLIRPVDVGEARFGMLETLREFAVGELERAGETDEVGHRHTLRYVELAETIEPELTGGSQDDAMSRLLQELENIRAALTRSLQPGERELGLRLASAIWRFWPSFGRLAEGREWLEWLLADATAPAVVRAKALVALGGLAYWQADHEDTWSRYQEALALYRSIDDRANEADVLYSLSMTATWKGDPSTGGRLAAEARSLFEEQGARDKVGQALMAQGFALWQDHDYAAARPLWEEALTISRELGDEALAVTQLAGLAGIDFHAGAVNDARRIALDALDLACDLENVALCTWLLDFIAAFAAADAPVPAVRLAGAADALRRASGGGMRIEDLHIESAQLAAARSLSPDELDQAWAEGRAMTLESAIDVARELRPVSIG